MKYRTLLATFLFSLCLTITSIGQTVSTMQVYCDFLRFNGLSNRLTSLTFTPLQKTMVINGNLVTLPEIQCNASQDHPELLSGYITNVFLYPGVDYGMTNGILNPVIKVTFKFSTNDVAPVNIALKLTSPTNLPNGVTAYSTTASDAKYQLHSTNLDGWAMITTNQLSGGTTPTNIFFENSNPSNVVSTTVPALAFNTNGMVWINRNGASNNWLVLITTNR